VRGEKWSERELDNFFPSIGHLVEHLDRFDAAQEIKLAKSGVSDHRSVAGGPSRFNGHTTYEQARRMAVEGWPAGLPSLKAAMALARAPYEYSTSYDMPAGVDGPVVDPGAYFSGVPECYHTPVEVQLVQLGYDGVEVVFNMSVSHAVSKETIYARGATAMLLSHVCSMSNIPCRIVAGMVGGPGSFGGDASWASDSAVVLSDWDDSLDWPLLAFWLCHPAALRRIGFRVYDSVSDQCDAHAYGYPTNTCYKGGDRFKRIVINHGLSRRSLEDPQTAIDEIISILVKDRKIEVVA